MVQKGKKVQAYHFQYIARNLQLRLLFKLNVVFVNLVLELFTFPIFSRPTNQIKQCFKLTLLCLSLELLFQNADFFLRWTTKMSKSRYKIRWNRQKFLINMQNIFNLYSKFYQEKNWTQNMERGIRPGLYALRAVSGRKLQMKKKLFWGPGFFSRTCVKRAKQFYHFQYIVDLYQFSCLWVVPFYLLYLFTFLYHFQYFRITPFNMHND